MNEALSVRYDPRLTEEAAFYALRGRPEAQEFQNQHDRVYEIADAEERERLFGDLSRSWFNRLALGGPVEQALGEQPSIRGGVGSCFVLCAPQTRDQGAELFVASDESPALFELFESPSVPFCEKGMKGHFLSSLTGRESRMNADFSPSLPLWKRGIKGDFSIRERSATARRTLRILLTPESLLKPEALLTFLRQELFHIADMLDPAFAYEPALPKADGGPTYDTLITHRYRVLWDVTINGRMLRRGWLPASVRDEQLDDFLRAFPMLKEKSAELFNRFSDGERPAHPELAAFAFDPRAAAGTLHGAATPGTHCPLCKFPTYIFEPEPDHLGRDVLDAINEDFPEWTAALGLCAQCADLYRAKQLSVAAMKQLPGWHQHR